MLSKFTHLVLALSLAGATHVLAQAQHSPQEEEARRAKEEEEEGDPKYKVVHVHSSWYGESLKKRPDIRKAEAAFNKYFSKHPEEKSKYRVRFENWLESASLYMNKAGKGGRYPTFEKTSAGLIAQQGGPASPDGIFGTWKMIGPANMGKRICGNNDNVTGGFCDRVYVNPYNTKNLFAGFAQGGLWVSLDQGGTWQLTDGSFPNGTNGYGNNDGYYGEIEAHKMDSNLVFAATEAGLLKSADGGINWTLLPVLNRNNSPQERPYYVALATNDRQVVLSTFGRKLYRSTDGGTTWSVVFDNSGGGVNRNPGDYTFNSFGFRARRFNFFGLEANFSNPNEFYIGAWNSSEEACIYKSTDKGATFTLLVNLSTLLNPGWNTSARLVMKTIPSSPDMFSVLEYGATGKPRYRISSAGSLLGADTVKATMEGFDIDWNNRNIMYQGKYLMENITKSTDSGRTFIKPYTPGTCNYLHWDIRAISAVGDVVLIGNDGGLGLSLDGGKSIVGTGFNTHAMEMWGFASSPKSDILVTGMDHNQIFARRFEGTGGWRNVKGADAGMCMVNPYQDRWLYYLSTFTARNKGILNDDGSVTESSLAGNVDLNSLKFHPYFAYNIFGTNGNQMVQSSDNMATATVFKDFGKSVNAILMAARDPKTMYVLLSNRNIMKTTDSGATWVDVTPPSAVNGGQTNITAIETGKTPGELWAAYGNAQNAVKVLYSTDGGASWTNITTPNLPAVAVNDLAYQRGTNGGVYISTITMDGTKIWYRNNTMPQWEQVGSNLPMMGFVRKLFIVPAKNKIRFGSSRGAWESDLYEKSGVQAGLAASKQKVTCSLDSVEFYNASAVPPGTIKYEWRFPGGSPAVSQLENPKVVYPVMGQYDVTLKVTDANGNTDSITWAKIIRFERDICGSTDTVAGNMLDISGADISRTPLKKLAYNSTDFTIMFWVKPTGLQRSFSQIISVRATNRLGIGFAFKDYNSNTNLVLSNTTIPYWVTSPLNLVPGEWSHVAVTYTATGAKVYVNGGAPWIVTGNFAPIDFSQQPLMVNDDLHGQNGNFKGQLEELSIYNRIMTQQEIREKMHLVRRRSGETGLICYYQFNQYDSQSSTLYDALASGSSSMVNKSLIVPSTAPVAVGVSETKTVTAAGAVPFPQAGLTLTYAASGAYPKGDVVVSRLESAPAVVPVTGASRYWVIHNYYDTLANANAITQLQLHPASADSLHNLRLQKRVFNSMGAWSDPASGNGLTFDVSANDIRNRQVAFEATPNNAPAFTAPASLSVYRNDTGVYNADTAVTGAPSAITDDSGVPPSITFSDAVTDTAITRSWKAMDNMGRSSLQTQLILLKDTIAPVIQYADSLLLCYNTASTYTLPAVQATDNYAVKAIRYTISGATTRSGNGADASGTFNTGVSQIGWEVTDKSGNTSTRQVVLTVNAPLQVSVPDVYAVNPGGAANTIYLGYGPQALTLSAEASGGTAPFTYHWSNDSTQSTTMVQPASAGQHSYTVTITDAKGCTADVSQQVTVADIRSGDGKVYVCHERNTTLTLSINTGSVQEHLAHGDQLGACGATLSGAVSKAPAGDDGGFTAQVQPNPSATGFVLKVNAKQASGFILRVYNLLGQLVEELKANTNEEVRFGQSYKPGMYVAEIRLGTLRKTMEVIKL